MLPNCLVRTDSPQLTAVCHVLLMSSRMPHLHSPTSPSPPILSPPLPTALLHQHWVQADLKPQWRLQGQDVRLTCLSTTAALHVLLWLHRFGGCVGGWGSRAEGIPAEADTTAQVTQKREGTDGLCMCLYPFKGWSWLCSAAKRRIFFP